ncbi:uncharacterized protein LOC123867145 isoform X2 [Maniola jurtina]|uniref:uncharacterized protein LOC123867145 isoform X2 n=1 Tax=Maniola jurtina TaxID=191418 RepID=UPI001E68DD1B|nr:uncharacterized protein LOC123867145 isoform X2 [Maniola jurtina]
MSNSSIMSVREMIDTCFGEPDVNIVNFKLMQTILYLLARQQRLLERKVTIEFEKVLIPRTSSLSITEVKLKANVVKKKKKITKPGAGPTTGAGAGASAKLKADKYSKSTTDETTTSTDKTFRSTAEPISTDTTKSTTDKTSTSKSTTEKSIADKVSFKPTKDIPKTLKSMVSRDEARLEASINKTGNLKDLYQKESSSSEKSASISTRKTSKLVSEKVKSSSDKTRTDKTLSAKGHEDEAISGKAKKRDYHHLLELIEQQRERELRVVNQRADSREVAEKTPTPMASLDSMEVQYEKLLVVERVPIEEAEKNIGRLREGKVPKLDIVTKDEFDELAQVVKEIQTKFGLGEAELPDNVQLMEDLSRSASLTDARAALLLSARLEHVEKTLNVMESLLNDLAVKKGTKIKQKQDAKEPIYAVQHTQITANTPATNVIYDAPSGRSNTARKSGIESKNIPTNQVSEPPFNETEEPVMGMLEEMPKANYINPDDLDVGMQELYEELLNYVRKLTNQAVSKADEALKTACRLEIKLDAAMDVDTRMECLETLVSEYAGKINALDINLSSQMSNYQEQLTQMQHDLEGGLETMAETLANPPGEIPGAAELNANFASLQVQFDTTNMKQNELKENQLVLSLDIQALWKEIELLREIKSDRDEVADALRDKAGLGALNGLVTVQQFDAVRGEFEQRIGASYDKFNNQEIVWQKIIDDLLRELNDKADLVQVSALRDDINSNLERLRNKIHTMMEIVGEPRAAAVSRRLLRDAACLSCSSPAQMNLEENTLPALPAFSKASTRPPTIGAEDTTKPKEDGDHGLCYPGQPIPHPRDPRSYFCRRYCGGSHTAARGALSRAPAELTISNLRRETTGVGSDGKVYKMDEQEKNKKPCLACNIQLNMSEEGKDSRFESDPETAQFYVLPVMTSAGRAADSVSVTPPLPVDDD